MFEHERTGIATALDSTGHRAVIEHIGSTSVPGLAAKPIIDIMVGLVDPAAFDRAGEEPWRADQDRDIEPRGHTSHVRLVRALQALGYIYRSEADIPGRLFFRRNAGNKRSHHAHVVMHGGDEWEKHLLFRDFLRAHPQWAQVYADAKRKLAVTHSDDRVAYTDAKTPLIAELTGKARVWKDAPV